jgi:hypothetical protein
VAHLDFDEVEEPRRTQTRDGECSERERWMLGVGAFEREKPINGEKH